MNRRQLLAGAFALGALTASPLAFGGVSPKRRRAKLTEAWERASRVGRPLLVIIVPDDDHKWDRGQRFGIWLNNAPDEDLAPLAGLEPAAATLEELDRLVPGVKDASTAWMVLVRVDQPTPTWRSIVVPDVPPSAMALSYEDFVAKETATSKRDLDWSELRQRYQAHEEAAGKVRLEAELVAFRQSADRVFASDGLAGNQPVSVHAALARDGWVKQAPPGTHWAVSGGCGMHIERNPDDSEENGMYAVGCGMGHVEAYAQRFLHFWDIAS